MERRYGSKYDRTLTTTQVAAKFRQDVKVALKAGDLPKGLKLSVRTSYFSGGSSIDVHIVACPFPILNRDRVRIGTFRANGGPVPPIHSAEAATVIKRLEQMLAAYNHDGSDSQTDYFDVKYYAHVSVAWEVEQAERQGIEAELVAAGLVQCHGCGGYAAPETVGGPCRGHESVKEAC